MTGACLRSMDSYFLGRRDGVERRLRRDGDRLGEARHGDSRIHGEHTRVSDGTFRFNTLLLISLR